MYIYPIGDFWIAGTKFINFFDNFAKKFFVEHVISDLYKIHSDFHWLFVLENLRDNAEF